MKTLLAILLVAARTLAADLTLAWDANTDLFDAYVVHCKTGDVESIVDVGQDTAVTLSGLMPGLRYDVWVTARWGWMESGPSNIVSGVLVNVELQESSDLQNWTLVRSYNQLVEGAQRFYRLSVGTPR